jgi:hypothetical protein
MARLDYEAGYLFNNTVQGRSNYQPQIGIINPTAYKDYLTNEREDIKEELNLIHRRYYDDSENTLYNL